MEEKKIFLGNGSVSEWITQLHPQMLVRKISDSLVKEMGSLIYYSELLNFSSYFSSPESMQHTDGSWLAQ